MTDGAPRNRWREAAGSAVLSFGVVLFEQILHASRGAVFDAPHVLLDAALAFPLALIAVAIARRSSIHRGFIAAGVFTLLLVPSVLVHEWMHAGTTSMAGHAIDETPWFVHGARDALLAFPVALLIAVSTLTASRQVRRRIGTVALAAVTAFTVLPAQGAPTITPFAVPLPIPQTLTDANITLTAAQASVPILPGAATEMWTYNGTFPGPTIRRPSGQPTNVTVLNQLPAGVGELTMHHHGNHSAAKEDGQPHEELIPSGGGRTYRYDLTEAGAPERGAFQWYHDHRMDVTGRNVWMGLAGMVILDDPAEQTINAALPNGDRDVPLMITDRTFTNDNQIPYTFAKEGNLGNAILVNGAPQPFFEVADTKYRLRLLNASNIRSYDLSLLNGLQTIPMTQVASESGLLPAPVAKNRIVLGPAERAEVVVDFAGLIGKDVVLRNSIGFGPNLSAAMQFRVRRDETDASTVPATLRAVPTFLDDEPIVATRAWTLGRDLGTGMWTINGNGFDHARVDAKPKLNTAERWIFTNTTEADHIVHIHDVDWRIVARTPTVPSSEAALGEDSLRESFRIKPNEVVVVVSRFTDHLGRYVLHCHMLEHEDFAMMAQFEVVA